jgi:hypothetical protein
MGVHLHCKGLLCVSLCRKLHTMPQLVSSTNVFVYHQCAHTLKVDMPQLSACALLVGATSGLVGGA